MLRSSFERAMQQLKDEVLMQGSTVKQALFASVEALKQRDLEASQRLIDEDRLINERRFAIEAEALAVLATEQPVASDLRIIAAVLEINTELERIGDYAKGIGKISLLIGETPLLKPLVDIPRMAERACDMLDKALQAFVEQDVKAARAIPKLDDEVDDLYNQVYRELMTYLIADPTKLEQANHLLWAAHNLERAADRVTNICERVVFTATGEMSELDIEDGVAGSID